MNNDPGDYHIPVLLAETLGLLVSRPDGTYIDGTLGGGGHAAGVLDLLDDRGRILGIDRDADAISTCARRFAREPRLTAVHANAVDLRSIVSHAHISRIDGILLDLGVSSHQLDIPARGFSFQRDGPLDMRMNAGDTRTAADIVNGASVDELAGIIARYGEERMAGRIARAIVARRTRTPFRSTGELADLVRRCAPRHAAKSAARVFQALRIAVNRELELLEETLRAACDLLAVGGRLVVIAYHSLEDRLVKTAFRFEAATCVCPPGLPVCVCGKVQRFRILTPTPIAPDEAEIRRNPRARSARLRAGEKIHT